MKVLFLFLFFMTQAKADLSLICAWRTGKEVTRLVEQGRNGRWGHCMASCLIVNRCGVVATLAADYGKEIVDTLRCLKHRTYEKCEGAFQKGDFLDDFSGASCPTEQMSCESCCEFLLTAPPSKPGPFTRFFKTSKTQYPAKIDGI